MNFKFGRSWDDLGTGLRPRDCNGRRAGQRGRAKKTEADSCLEHREDPKPQLELKEGECPGEEPGGLGCIQSIQSFSSVLQLSQADPHGEQGTPKRRTLQHPAPGMQADQISGCRVFIQMCLK